MTAFNFQEIIDALHDNAAIVNENGRIMFVNQSWMDFSASNSGNVLQTDTGANYFNVINKAARQGDHHAIDMQNGIQKILDRTISVYELEYPCHSENEERWFIVTVTEIQNSSQRALLFLHKNITDLVVRERKIREAHRLQALGQFTGGIAHDFNNLLGIVLGNLELAKSFLENQENVELYINNSLTAVERGAALIKNLLSFARSQSLEPDYIDINRFIRDLCKFLWRILGEDIDIDMDIAENSQYILVDTAMLSSAIFNIAINARHAMPQGGKLTIQVSQVDLYQQQFIASEERVSGSYTKISFTDTGCGIERENLSRVLEPFYTTREVGEGSGLGLSMVSGFLSQSNGYIDIDSHPGKGTTIFMYFPLVEEHEINQAETIFRPLPIGESRTVLLVEDDPSVRNVIAQMLVSLNFNVMQAGDGVSCLDILEQDPGAVDLILTDIIMPSGMSGTELMNKISHIYPDKKVILMTGYPDNEMSRAGINSTQDILTKPFSISDLSKVLQN